MKSQFNFEMFCSMLPVEQKYAGRQSQQISMQTGFISHMQVDENEFVFKWKIFRPSLNTFEFNEERDIVINALCSEEYNCILKTKANMLRYCQEHAESKFDENTFGFRVNTEKFAYLFRLNPVHNKVFCYAYVRSYLDEHIKKAERGIRFIDSNYHEKFRIPDGEKIRITTSWGESTDYVCRYIDDYHLEVGNYLYHICELAEHLEHNGATITPLETVDTPHA